MVTPARAALMDGLKARLLEILPHIPKDAPLALLDVPVYGNIGDLLINLGTELLFAEHGLKISLRLSTLDYLRFRSRVTDRHCLIFHGGGNLGDLWPMHEELRWNLLRLFPANRVIVLPQTAHFSAESNLAWATKIYNRRENCVFFARDRATFELIRGSFGVPCHLMPDMAHYLWKTASFPSGTPGRGELRLIRRDKESALADRSQGKDWPSILGPLRTSTTWSLAKLIRYNPSFAMQPGLMRLWYNHCSHITRSASRHFGDHSTVHTDRLHALILALLLGREVTYSDNSYGKLSGYAQAWLDGVKMRQDTA